MKEIILCRLGSCFAPFWIQMKWFEHNNIHEVITLETKCQNISNKEWNEYQNNPHHRQFVDKESYIHYEKVNNPDPFRSDYEYTDKRGYEFICENEKDRFYLENEKLDRNFLNCFKKKLDVSSEKEMRTNKYLIKLVKEYQKAFPEGDENSWFGKWCYNVVSIPDDVEYEIDEPEGCNECIREVHRVWLFNGKQVGKNKNEIKK